VTANLVGFNWHGGDGAAAAAAATATTTTTTTTTISEPVSGELC